MLARADYKQPTRRETVPGTAKRINDAPANIPSTAIVCAAEIGHQSHNRNGPKIISEIIFANGVHRTCNGVIDISRTFITTESSVPSKARYRLRATRRRRTDNLTTTPHVQSFLPNPARRAKCTPKARH